MFKSRSATNAWVLILRVNSTNGPEKIIHISDCCRLLKLANFVFHVYKDDPNNSDFEFFYFDSESRSYGNCFSFKLKKGDIPLPAGVGNMTNARIDSAFFNESQLIGLRKENRTQEYAIECLQTVPPKKGRRYPFVET